VVLWDVSVPAHPAQRAALSHPRPHPKAAAVTGVVIDQALACVREVDFSPDGWSLACHCDKTVVLWDVTDLAHPAQRAALTHQGRPGLAGAMGFSPDGRLLATGAKNAVVLWDVAALAHPAQAATVQLSRTGRGGPVLTVRAVAFSPDGRSLAAGSGQRVERGNPVLVVVTRSHRVVGCHRSGTPCPDIHTYLREHRLPRRQC
jgi:WD40 repeat protein